MLNECYIAVDIGASNGNVYAGYLQEEKLLVKELHRFPNNLIEKNGSFIWDIDQLFKEIMKGIHKCTTHNLLPKSIGIDTWAVDFALLDENDQLLTDIYSYRDPRTDGMMEKVFHYISKEELYSLTGIQFQKFNTIYQLYSLKENQPDVLQNAKSLLMIPDYINFLLTGKKINEYTNATTTQLVHAQKKDWDERLIEKLGFNRDIFLEICPPKTILGSLLPKYKEQFGFDLKVVLPATHDTASAVLAVPEPDDDTIYISSGTWSLIGTEIKSPICTNEALKNNFTNEGGFENRYRFLKNIMGLWMIQEVKRLYMDKYSYEDLVNLAMESSHFSSIVDVNDVRFLKPKNMIEEIQNFCKETEQEVPITPGEIAKCIYASLVESYFLAVEQLENILQKQFHQINIIGGGAQNKYLNQLIANKTKREVIAGPIEATAIGNIVAQMIALGEISSVEEARRKIKNSFQIHTYTYNE